MKKLIALLMTLAALTSFALAESYDFSTHDTQTLNEIDAAIRSELLKRAISGVSTLSYDATYEGEIMFRGIPWGTNYSDARQMLTSSGFFTDKCGIGSYNYLYEWSLDPYNAQIYHDCGIWLEQGFRAGDRKVAGYDVSTTRLYFMYTLDGNTIKRDANDVELFMVIMGLKVTDHDLSFADLVQKLNSIYGEGDEWSHVNPNWGGDTKYEKWAAWYGENNTSVLLYMMYERDNDTQVISSYSIFDLYYGKTDCEPQLVAISHALEHEKKEQEIQKLLENANNIDGLI